MNTICLIGIHQFLYLYLIHSYSVYKYKKSIALLVYINGIICHSFIKTKYGRNILYTIY